MPRKENIAGVVRIEIRPSAGRCRHQGDCSAVVGAGIGR